jgi:hypothetical protein
MSPQDEQDAGKNRAREAERDARHAPETGKDGTGRTQSSHQSSDKSSHQSSNQSSANNGLLQVDTGKLKLPQGLSEEEDEPKRFFSIDPAVLIILCFSLIFIMTIAYVIWSGWEPPQP